MVLNQLSEKEFYENLSSYLKLGQYKQFADLLNQSSELDIHVNPKLIQHRFDYIRDLIKKCLKRVVESYQIDTLGKIIDILRFFNQFNLFEKDLSLDEQAIVDDTIKNAIFISNLNDLFGKISNSFILYLRKELPKIIFKYLTNSRTIYFEDPDKFIDFVKNVFWDQYTIYGLNIKKISTFETFFNNFKKNCKNLNRDFIEFNVYYDYYNYNFYDELKKFTIVKRHLVSPKNIFLISDEVLNSNKYKFHSLSMVLLGGIGPQGHGFTYTTPKKEVIEICSDIRENDAIIIKYKLYLKNQFLTKLRIELSSLNKELRDNIIKYLDVTLNQNELIGYNKNQKVLKIISNYLRQFSEVLDQYKLNIDDLLEFITETVSLILRPINMIDQFKLRMDLINEGKLNSDDVAKLTSLKGKSHYDVLKERLFFQYINDWFYELYLDAKNSN